MCSEPSFQLTFQIYEAKNVNDLSTVLFYFKNYTTIGLNQCFLIHILTKYL